MINLVMLALVVQLAAVFPVIRFSDLVDRRSKRSLWILVTVGCVFSHGGATGGAGGRSRGRDIEASVTLSFEICVLV